MKTLEKAKQAFADQFGSGKVSPAELKKFIQEQVVKNGDDPLKPHHLNTVVNTNLQNAYSKGRFEEQKKSGAPYWRYSAITDNDVTDLCQGLHGQIFNKDDPFWETYYPPNHFNCRSLVDDLFQEDLDDYGWKVNQTSGSKFVRKINGMIGAGFGTSPSKSLDKWLNKETKKYDIKQEDFKPTKEEQNSIYGWTYEDYTKIKTSIKKHYENGNPLSTQAKDIISLFDKYKQNGNLKKPIYRGLRFRQKAENEMKDFETFTKSWKVGNTENLDISPCSSTYSKQKAEVFGYLDYSHAHTVMIKIVKRKSKGFEIDNFSHYKTEEEVLLKPNMKLKVLKRKETIKKGKSVIDLECEEI